MVQKNERFKSVGKDKEWTCLKGKAEISGWSFRKVGNAAEEKKNLEDHP